MSNVDAARGLSPSHYMDGTPWNGATFDVYISASYAVALYVGDPVLLSPTDGEADATAKRLTVNRSAGTDGTIILGVIAGFQESTTNASLTHNPASTERAARVVKATPDLVFRIQDDGSGTPAAAWVGQNATIAVGAGGSTVTGRSGFEILGSSVGADQSNTVLIVGLSDIPGNEIGDFAIWDVLINTSRNATGTYLGVTPA